MNRLHNTLRNDASTGAPLVALTGITGFVGSHMGSALLQAGMSVRALARHPQKSTHYGLPNIEWVSGDLRDPTTLDGLVRGVNHVVHIGGLTKALSWDEFSAVNVDAANALAAACQSHKVARLIALSSITAREPGLSPYARSKNLGETAIATAFPQATILRPPAIYGPGDEEVIRLLAPAKHGFLPVPGPMDARLAIIHVADVVSAILAIIRMDKPLPGVFELHDGRPEGYNWREIAAVLSATLGRRVRPIKVSPLIMRAAGQLSDAWARISQHASVFGSGKVRELAHPDWSVRHQDLARFCDWKPEWDLARGAASVIGRART